MASKKKTTSSGADLSSIIDSTFAKIEGVSIKGATLGLMDRVEELYGVKHFIRTPWPSLNICLFSQSNGEMDEDGLPVEEYGFPTGRVVELHGDESSFKTYILQQLMVSTMKMGGVSYYLSSEMDFDADFFMSHFEKHNLSKAQVDKVVRVGSIRDIDSLAEALTAILKNYGDASEKSKEFLELPKIIVVDSIGAMSTAEDREKAEKGDSNRTGGLAGALHNIFKRILFDAARMNVLIIFSNHLRSNIGNTYNPTKPASDSAIKYYCSTRLEFKTMNGSTSSRNNRVMIKDRYLRVKVIKNRRATVGNNKIFLRFKMDGSGFDYLDSLIEAMMWCGLALPEGALTKTHDSSKYKMEPLFDQLATNPWLDPFLEELDQFANGNKVVDVKALKKLLCEPRFLETAVRIEKLCYKLGPERLVLKEYE